jgi:hypothetical protein
MISRVIDRIGARNRRLNEKIVGVEAATFAARCVAWALLLTLLGAGWAVVYIWAVAIDSTTMQGYSLLILVVVGMPIAWRCFHNNAVAARLAADYFEPKLGFRPKWWMCYSLPRGWRGALERQKRWHARGRWPLITW